MFLFFFFFFKQKTAYEMVMSDWSSDVCSSDLVGGPVHAARRLRLERRRGAQRPGLCLRPGDGVRYRRRERDALAAREGSAGSAELPAKPARPRGRAQFLRGPLAAGVRRST